MKTIGKAALGALALASLGLASATPASAQTSFGFSFGTSPYYGGYYYSDPCYRPYPYRPGYCYRPVAPAYGYYRPYYRPYAYYSYRDRYWDRGRHRGWYR
jgi:hypothetical protein